MSEDMKLNLQIQKLDFIISLYIFCIAVAELMGSKIFPIVNYGAIKLNASVAIFVIPLIFTINDVITEVYGAERTRSIIRSGLIVVFFIFLFSLFAVSLPTAERFKSLAPAYDAVFRFSARISAASLTAFAIAEFLDVAVFVKLRRRLGKKALWFRNNLSNFISQLCDTVVFMSLAFYAFDKPFHDNAAFLLSLIVPYWLLKCAMSVIETPLVYLGVRWLKGGSK